MLKMLMEIGLPKMRGLLVVTMAMISPSRREVSQAEQLCRSPRLVPPRFRLVAVALRPESLLMTFSGQKISYSQRWAPEACQGAHETGERAPTLLDGGWPPSSAFFTQYFLYIPKLTFVEFQDFWSCAE